jgi:hypothetical protein
MRYPWSDASDLIHRNQACLDDQHDGCPHVRDAGVMGFTPRGILLGVALDFAVGLCKCECHASCPISGRRISIPSREWHDSCSCPGAQAKRDLWALAGIGVPDFREKKAEVQRESRLRREAFDAVRARAAGRSRAEIRDLYEDELRARGVRIPADEVLDAKADAIAGDYRSSVRMAGSAVADLAKLVGSMLRTPR